MRHFTVELQDKPVDVHAGDVLKVTHKLYHYGGRTYFALGYYEFEALGFGRVIGVKREFDFSTTGIYDFTISEPELVWDPNYTGTAALMKDAMSINGASVPITLMSLEPGNIPPLVQDSQVCPDCRGKGKIELFTSIETCTSCHGKGKV